MDEQQEPASGTATRLAALPLETFSVAVGDRRFSITAIRDQDALLAVSDRFEQFPYGLLLWESAVALAAVLLAGRFPLAGRRVLEIGAGVGLAGIAARAAGADVVQTDHEPLALAIARRNARANGIGGIRQRLADWRAWPPLGRFGLIVAADVAYDAATHDDILRVLEASLVPGGTALFTDPCRTATPALIRRLERAGYHPTVARVPVPSLPDGARTIAIDLIVGRRVPVSDPECRTPFRRSHPAPTSGTT